MKTVHAVIEFTHDNLGAYLKEVNGMVGIGDNLSEVKKSLQESIEIYKEECQKDGLKIPEPIKGEYEIVYQYDLCSFLQAYSDILSKSGLEVITGINQKQLWHYANGKSKPRKVTIEKVAASVHAFAKELEKINFV